MSIFTFMGASVMRLDDSYSFQVINKTVKMVIPALIQVSSLHTVISYKLRHLRGPEILLRLLPTDPS